MAIRVNMENNTRIVKRELTQKKERILYAWGLFWQSTSTKIITLNGIVDTGRLRASLSFITPTRSGDVGKVGNSKANDILNGSAPEGSLLVGSNVEYAAKQELGNKKGAFIRPAIMNYQEEYTNIAKNILKE